jgi:hypothetical protein
MKSAKSGPWRPAHPAPIEFVARAHALRAIAFRDTMRWLFRRRPSASVTGAEPPRDILL